MVCWSLLALTSASESGDRFTRRWRRCRGNDAAAIHRALAMSKHDRFKEEIGWLKALCGLLLAVCTSLIAWLVQNYGTGHRVTLVAAMFCLPVLVVGIVAIVVRLYRCFKILETL